jgi:glycerol-3-phosphate dehydrogenase (NAD(P)+)
MKFDQLTGESLPRSAHPYRRLAVIGAGAYGTALAHVAAQDGTQVSLWSRRPEIARLINEGPFAICVGGREVAYPQGHQML